MKRYLFWQSWIGLVISVSLMLQAHAQTNTARTGQFFRGTGNDQQYHSLVVALDFQKGIPLDNIGGIATNLFDWSAPTYYHLNATNAASRIPFENSIVAFGSRVGGSPLYVGRKYSWGVYGGEFDPEISPYLYIEAYYRTNFEFTNYFFLFLPNHAFYPDYWRDFATNGFATNLTELGLTVRAYNVPERAWGVSPYYSYVLTLEAQPEATNYIFDFYLLGYTDQGDMVVDDTGDSAYSDLFTAEFDERPPGQAVFLDQPHFDGTPLPPEYAGKSVEELTNFTASATNAVWLTNDTGYLTVDQSPELRRHPLLDQLVTDLRNDPLALTAYVVNEIELTDALAYGEDGQVPEDSVNLGGVNRSALGTFLEKQGSPTEQCALLVYLLRQAGYPAAYVFHQQQFGTAGLALEQAAADADSRSRR